MRETINKFQPDTEFFIEEGCHIIELSNSDNDSGLSIARARVEPGVTTHWHKLTGIAERYVILEGQGRMEVGDLAPEDVATGDVVVIPPECPQRITNTGSGDLVFLALCTPRFLAGCYEDLQEQPGCAE